MVPYKKVRTFIFHGIHYIGYSSADIVSCVSLDPSNHYFISGSYDLSCMVWKIQHHAGSTTGILEQPLQTLHGHDDAVNTVAMVWELDMAVSGSKVCFIICCVSDSRYRNLCICCKTLLIQSYFKSFLSAVPNPNFLS